MGLGDERFAILRQPVVDARDARVVDGSPVATIFNGWPGGVRRADQLEEAALRLVVEEQVGEEEVLVGVAREQLLLRRVAVEEALPLRDPLRRRRGQRRRAFVAGALLEPARERAVLAAMSPGRP